MRRVPVLYIILLVFLALQYIPVAKADGNIGPIFPVSGSKEIKGSLNPKNMLIYGFGGNYTISPDSMTAYFFGDIKDEVDSGTALNYNPDNDKYVIKYVRWSFDNGNPPTIVNVSGGRLLLTYIVNVNVVPYTTRKWIIFGYSRVIMVQISVTINMRWDIPPKEPFSGTLADILKMDTLPIRVETEVDLVKPVYKQFVETYKFYLDLKSLDLHVYKFDVKSTKVTVKGYKFFKDEHLVGPYGDIEATLSLEGKGKFTLSGVIYYQDALGNRRSVTVFLNPGAVQPVVLEDIPLLPGNYTETPIVLRFATGIAVIPIEVKGVVEGTAVSVSHAYGVAVKDENTGTINMTVYIPVVVIRYGHSPDAWLTVNGVKVKPEGLPTVSSQCSRLEVDTRLGHCSAGRCTVSGPTVVRCYTTLGVQNDTKLINAPLYVDVEYGVGVTSGRDEVNGNVIVMSYASMAGAVANLYAILTTSLIYGALIALTIFAFSYIIGGVIPGPAGQLFVHIAEILMRATSYLIPLALMAYALPRLAILILYILVNTPLAGTYMKIGLTPSTLVQMNTRDMVAILMSTFDMLFQRILSDYGTYVHGSLTMIALKSATLPILTILGAIVFMRAASSILSSLTALPDVLATVGSIVLSYVLSLITIVIMMGLASVPVLVAVTFAKTLIYIAAILAILAIPIGLALTITPSMVLNIEGETLLGYALFFLLFAPIAGVVAYGVYSYTMDTTIQILNESLSKIAVGPEAFAPFSPGVAAGMEITLGSIGGIPITIIFPIKEFMEITIYLSVAGISIVLALLPVLSMLTMSELLAGIGHGLTMILWRS